MYIGISVIGNSIIAGKATPTGKGLSKCANPEDITDQAIRAVIQYMHKEAEETGVCEFTCELGALTFKRSDSAKPCAFES